MGTIYSTRMNSVMVANKTRIDSANPDSDGGVVILKMKYIRW